MPPLDIETALDWRGRTVVDRDGEKIGTFDELYLDDSDRPAWAAVTTGLFGMRQTFVPLSEAQPDGDVLRVPFDKDAVKDAPNVDPDAQLSSEEEDKLYRHYGLRGGGARGEESAADAAGDQGARSEAAPAAEHEVVSREERPVADDEQVAERRAGGGGDRVVADDEQVAERRAGGGRERVVANDEQVAERRAEGGEERAVADEATAGASRGGGERVARGEGEGAEVIRSEEEVHIGTRRRATERARLRKYVVTDHVKKVVPVQREEVRVEYEPVEGEGAEDDTARERPDTNA